MFTCEQHNNITCEVTGFFHIWVKCFMLEINMWNAIMSHVNTVKFFLFTWRHITWHMTWNVLIHMWTKISPFENRIISHANWMWQHQHVKFTFSHINYVISHFSHRRMKSWEMILFTCGCNIFEWVAFLKYEWQCPHRNIFTYKLQTFTCYWLFVTCGHKTWRTKSCEMSLFTCVVNKCTN